MVSLDRGLPHQTPPISVAMETDGDSRCFYPFSTFVGSFQVTVTDTWPPRLRSFSLKTECVRSSTALKHQHGDGLWSTWHSDFIQKLPFSFQEQNRQKTELESASAELSCEKNACALPCFASLFSSLGMSYTWNIWHTYSFDIYYIFLLYSKETTLRWHTIWFLNWSFC